MIDFELFENSIEWQKAAFKDYGKRNKIRR